MTILGRELEFLLSFSQGCLYGGGKYHASICRCRRLSPVLETNVPQPWGAMGRNVTRMSRRSDDAYSYLVLDIRGEIEEEEQNAGRKYCRVVALYLMGLEEMR